MSIELKRLAGWVLALAWLAAGLSPVRLGAVTLEVEEGDSNASPASAPAGSAGAPSAGMTENKPAKVRISEKVGFYYFMKSGFVLSDDLKVPMVGKVLKSERGSDWYDTGSKTHVELAPHQRDVKTGDLLVVYRTDHRVEEAHSGFSGWWIRNLAVVKVLEVDKRSCEVEVKKSFYPFVAGDKVRLYEDEISRWKQAQIKKPLPDHSVSCFVVTAESNEVLASQADSVVLTAGSKKGVVEGQRFQLKDTIFHNSQPVRVNQGIAQVFYVGANSSMAQILYSHGPVKTGFEAAYLP